MCDGDVSSPRQAASVSCCPDINCRAAAAAPCRDEGVGLAAPQVGVNVRLMVFNEAGEKGQGDEVRWGRCLAAACLSWGSEEGVSGQN
jgi:hypothetical protein